MRVVMRVFLLPVSMVRWFGRLVTPLLARVVAPILGTLDRSSSLSVVINSLSSSMATNRGLLLLIGAALMVISLLVHAFTVFGLVVTNTVGMGVFWLCIPFSLAHLGVLIGFTGIMLATPLGQGYKDNK